MHDELFQLFYFSFQYKKIECVNKRMLNVDRKNVDHVFKNNENRENVSHVYKICIQKIYNVYEKVIMYLKNVNPRI